MKTKGKIGVALFTTAMLGLSVPIQIERQGAVRYENNLSEPISSPAETSSSVIEISSSETIDEPTEPQKSQLTEIVETYLAPAVLYAVANIATFIGSIVLFFKKLKSNTSSVQANSKELEKLKADLITTLASLKEVKKAVETTTEELSKTEVMKSEVDDINSTLKILVEALIKAVGTNTALIEDGMANEIMNTLKGGVANDNETTTEETQD